MVRTFVRGAYEPTLPPPILRRGPIGWAYRNLFPNWWNALLTAVVIWALYLVVPDLFEFVYSHAVWDGADRTACLASPDGACWAFVKAKLQLFIYGRYPLEERWRPNLVFLLGALVLLRLLLAPLRGRFRFGLLLLIAFPIVATILLRGGALGLSEVETPLWGGLLVTLVVSITGLALSFPLGVLLALGRQSELPAIRIVSVGFIEFWRGVPLVTVLFMASVMLPLILPDNVTLDKLLRAIIGVALFESAYMAEVVRGGLQGISRGQYEAAESIGLGYWRSRYLIILPQALRSVIPGIVNTVIALFKDTSLVLVIGLFDLLGMIQASLVDPKWATPTTAISAYLFAASIYWVFCFGMSRYSLFVERRLNVGESRTGSSLR